MNYLEKMPRIQQDIYNLVKNEGKSFKEAFLQTTKEVSILYKGEPVFGENNEFSEGAASLTISLKKFLPETKLLPPGEFNEFGNRYSNEYQKEIEFFLFFIPIEELCNFCTEKIFNECNNPELQKELEQELSVLLNGGIIDSIETLGNLSYICLNSRNPKLSKMSYEIISKFRLSGIQELYNLYRSVISDMISINNEPTQAPDFTDFPEY